MNHLSISHRLALCATGLPIVLFFVFVSWPIILSKVDAPLGWELLTFVVVSAFCLFVIFVTGSWKSAVVLFGSSILLFTFGGDSFYHMFRDEPIMLNLNFNMWLSDKLPDGTEIYCNNVLIGKTPFSISLDQLKKQVSPCNSPPKQKWFIKENQPIYTTIPWDSFIQDRRIARYNMTDQNNKLAFDSETEYWWDFRFRGIQFVGKHRKRDYSRSTTSQFWTSGNISFYSPSACILYDLLLMDLIENEKEKEPSQEWVELYLRFLPLWEGVGTRLTESAKKAIARKYYKLSEKPTAAECERAIRMMMKEMVRGSIDISNYRTVSFELYTLAATAVKLLGPECREPLRKLWREVSLEALNPVTNFDSEKDRQSVLLYITKEYPFPELFDDVVINLTRSTNAFSTMIVFDDPRVVPLLKTYVRGKWFPLPPFTGESFSASDQCALLLLVDNPILKEAVWELLAERIEFADMDTIPWILDQFLEVWGGTSKRDVDMDRQLAKELIAYISALPIAGSTKSEFFDKWQYVLDTKPLFFFGMTDSQLQEKAKEVLENLPDADLFDLFAAIRGKPMTPEELKNFDKVKMQKGSEFFSSLFSMNLFARSQYLNNFSSRPMPVISEDESRDWFVEHCIRTKMGAYSGDYFSSHSWRHTEEMIEQLANNFNEIDGVTFLRNPFCVEISGVNEKINKNITTGNITTWKMIYRFPGSNRWMLSHSDSIEEFGVNNNAFNPMIGPVSTNNPMAWSLYFGKEIDKEIESIKPKYYPGLTLIFATRVYPEVTELLSKWSESDDPILRKLAQEALVSQKYISHLYANRAEFINKLHSGAMTPDDLLDVVPAWQWNGTNYTQP
ncbi:MAG: hypothetical protein ACRCUY_13990 [Thermoguttaceae bacterium]